MCTAISIRSANITHIQNIKHQKVTIAFLLLCCHQLFLFAGFKVLICLALQQPVTVTKGPQIKVFSSCLTTQDSRILPNCQGTHCNEVQVLSQLPRNTLQWVLQSTSIDLKIRVLMLSTNQFWAQCSHQLFLGIIPFTRVLQYNVKAGSPLACPLNPRIHASTQM